MALPDVRIDVRDVDNLLNAAHIESRDAGNKAAEGALAALRVALELIALDLADSAAPPPNPAAENGMADWLEQRTGTPAIRPPNPAAAPGETRVTDNSDAFFRAHAMVAREEQRLLEYHEDDDSLPTKRARDIVHARVKFGHEIIKKAIGAPAALATPPAPETLDRATLEAIAAGFEPVSTVALRWLLGEGPDDNGKWFGDGVEAKKTQGPYWWRSTFRRLCTLSPTTANKPQSGETR